MTLVSDLKVAILAQHGASQEEIAIPRERLETAGVSVVIVSPQSTEVKAWKRDNWGIRIKVDQPIQRVTAEELHGIIIPGGPFHSDGLRTNKDALQLVQQCFASGKIIGCVGHGIQVLVSAGIIEGRQVTSSASLKTDVMLAKGVWMDEDVVVDNGLVTCRCEEHLENFNKIFLEELRQGVHQRSETII